MDDIIPQTIPQKQCAKCPNSYPATLQFFHAQKHGKYGLNSVCKKCRSQKWHDAHPKEDIPEEHKRCTQCQTILPATTEYFEPSKHNHIGLRPCCRQCRAKECKAYNDTHVEYRKRYYQEHKERMSKKDRQYYVANQVHIRKRARQQYILQAGAYDKRYQRTHAEQYRTYNNNRYARKKAVPGTFTSQQIQEQLKRQHYCCYYAACGYAKFKCEKGKYVYTIEHTFPITREHARNEISHIVLSCPSCNSKKNNKYPHEWPEGGRLL